MTLKRRLLTEQSTKTKIKKPELKENATVRPVDNKHNYLPRPLLNNFVHWIQMSTRHFGCRHSLGGAACRRRVVGLRVAAQGRPYEISGTGPQRPWRPEHRSKTLDTKRTCHCPPSRRPRRSRWACPKRRACRRTRNGSPMRTTPSRRIPCPSSTRLGRPRSPRGEGGDPWSSTDPSGLIARDVCCLRISTRIQGSQGSRLGKLAGAEGRAFPQERWGPSAVWAAFAASRRLCCYSSPLSACVSVWWPRRFFALAWPSSCEACTCSRGTRACVVVEAFPPRQWRVGVPRRWASSRRGPGFSIFPHCACLASVRIFSCAQFATRPWMRSLASWCGLGYSSSSANKQKDCVI